MLGKALGRCGIHSWLTKSPAALPSLSSSLHSHFSFPRWCLGWWMIQGAYMTPWHLKRGSCVPSCGHPALVGLGCPCPCPVCSVGEVSMKDSSEFCALGTASIWHTSSANWALALALATLLPPEAQWHPPCGPGLWLPISQLSSMDQWEPRKHGQPWLPYQGSAGPQDHRSFQPPLRLLGEHCFRPPRPGAPGDCDPACGALHSPPLAFHPHSEFLTQRGQRKSEPFKDSFKVCSALGSALMLSPSAPLPSQGGTLSLLWSGSLASSLLNGFLYNVKL